MTALLTLGGREETLPPEARGWIALHDDGTASGSYGCTPFHTKAEVTATSLTLGEAVTPLPSPSLSPAAPEGGPGPCHPDDVAGTPALADFEKKVKRVFSGEVTLSAGRPNGDTKLHVKNQKGDGLTLAQARREDFFKTRWQLDDATFYDSHGAPFAAGDQMYFDFHENGEVSGKLGCNDFTAKATFAGIHVFFHDPVLTTQRTCDTRVMTEEASVLATLKKSLNYSYWAETGSSLSLQDDLAFPANEHGFTFSALPRR
ncbi:META domain-containing protein [Streptomyces sp. RGM 3693]|uniref:META domain-containing protein n=1 Tax=Streptomyces sp. RGM 3693 TaxID=3413284 RepID=UPI003D2B2CAB